MDLDYPAHLHTKHNSYPLAAQSLPITEEMLSAYSRDCLHKLGSKRQKSVTKLISTLTPKTRYLVHERNLHLYLRLGMRLVKLHRGLVFEQSAFIKPFIEKCTQMRMEAPTKTEQEMWKLICNSLYGMYFHKHS